MIYFWEALVLIVLIAAVVKIVTGRQRLGVKTQDEAAELAQSRDEVEQLKQRIQVLERVITDTHGSHQLDQEIERLRDR